MHPCVFSVGGMCVCVLVVVGGVRFQMKKSRN